MRIIYITTRNVGEAKKISYELLNRKLVACTNIFPIESMYWYDKEIQEDTEFVILAKTNDGNYEKIEKAVKEMHSYDVPSIFSWKIDKVNSDYEKWINKETKAKK